jgi:phosphoribosylformimino-5-aminoimidazole carboxamide ribonucleotide (ProFAR) isomerase
VNQFVYSAIERDGMMGGPAIDEIKAVCSSAKGSIVYAGGIASLDDLAALKELRLVNLSGAIVGRALHEGAFTIADGNHVLAG